MRKEGRKKIKRKLIGFIAGEKGSIGKLQALVLGIGGLIASGLIPKIAHGWGDVWDDAPWTWGSDWPGDWGDGWFGDWGTWPDELWLTDVWLADWPINWPTDWPTNWSGNWSGNWGGDWSGDWSGDWGDWADWPTDWPTDWSGNWGGDWSGDWPTDWPANASPSVDEVKAK